MNTVARPGRRRRRVGRSARAASGRRRVPAPTTGREVVVGVRPEHLTLGGDGAVKGVVRHVEWLGHEALVTCDVGPDGGAAAVTLRQLGRATPPDVGRHGAAAGRARARPRLRRRRRTERLGGERETPARAGRLTEAGMALLFLAPSMVLFARLLLLSVRAARPPGPVPQQRAGHEPPLRRLGAVQGRARPATSSARASGTASSTCSSRCPPAWCSARSWPWPPTAGCRGIRIFQTIFSLDGRHVGGGGLGRSSTSCSTRRPACSRSNWLQRARPRACSACRCRRSGRTSGCRSSSSWPACRPCPTS